MSQRTVPILAFAGLLVLAGVCWLLFVQMGGPPAEALTEIGAPMTPGGLPVESGTPTSDLDRNGVERDELETPATPVDAGASLEGCVVQEDRSPLEGASVTVQWESVDAATEQEPRQIVSDAKGEFHLDALPVAADAELRVELAGFSTVVRRVKLIGSQDLGELILTPEARIRGIVLSTLGGVIADATIHAADSTATSDRGGEFLLRGVPPGEHWLRAEAPGFVGLPSPPVRTSTTSDLTGQKLHMEPAHTLRGTVFAAGDPLAGAEILVEPHRLFYSGNDRLPRQAGAQALRITTDVGGNFSMDGIPSGRLTLTVQHSTTRHFRKEYVEKEWQQPLRVDVTRSPLIFGHVVDRATGKRVEIDAVTLFAAYSQTGSWRNYGAVNSDPALLADGRFEFQTRRRSNWMRLAVEGSSFAPTVSDVFEVQQKQGCGPIIVEVSEGTRLRGSVVDDAGHAVAFARVRVTPASGEGTPWPANLNLREVETRTDGSFETAPLHPGVFSLRAQLQGFFEGQVADVELVESQTPETVRIVMNRSGSIRGIVRAQAAGGTSGLSVVAQRRKDEESEEESEEAEAEEALSQLNFSRTASLRGRELSFRSAELLRSRGNTRGAVDDRGRFLISDLQPGTYDVRVRQGGSSRGSPFSVQRLESLGYVSGSEAPEDEAPSGAVVEVRPGKEEWVEIVLEDNGLAMVGGTLRIDGAPASLRTVTLAPVEGGRRVSITDQQGQFLFAGVAAGAATISAKAQGQWGDLGYEYLDIEPSGQHQLDIDIALGSLTGRVIDALNKKPVRSCRVQLKVTDSRGRSRNVIRTQTDSRGRFEFDPAPSGSVQLSIDQSSYQVIPDVGVNVTAGIDTRMGDVRLIPTASVYVTAQLPRGVRSRDIEVLCERLDQTAPIVTAKGRRSATIRSLDEGRYRITVKLVETGASRSFEQKLTLRNRTTLRADFTSK